MQSELGLVLQLSVGLVFLLSSTTKVIDLEKFVTGLERYDIFPKSVVRLASAVIIGGELVIAVSHLSGYLLDRTAPVAVGMLLIFMIAVARAVSRGDQVPCLCFGSGSAELVSTRTLIRLVLLIFAETIIWFDVFTSQRPRLALEFGARNVLLAICTASLLLAALRWIFAGPDLYRIHKTSGDPRVCLAALRKS